MFQQLVKMFSGNVKPVPTRFNPDSSDVTIEQLMNEQRRIFTTRPRAEYKIGALITNNPDTFKFLKGRTNCVALCWVDENDLNVVFVDSTGTRFLDLVSIATHLKENGIYTFRWVAQGTGLKHQSLFSKVQNPNQGASLPFKKLDMFTIPMLGLADEPYEKEGV